MKSLAPQDKVKIQFAAIIISLLLALVGGMEASTFFFVSEARSLVFEDTFHSQWVLNYTATRFESFDLANQLEEEMTHLDHLYNRYGPYTNDDDERVTNLYDINHSVYGSGEWVTIDPLLYHMLELSYTMTLRDQGYYYNMFVGAYVDVWFPYILIGSGSPTDTAIQEAASCVPTGLLLVDHPILEFDPGSKSIKFNRLDSCPEDKKVSISLGGMIKGYALDRMIPHLETYPNTFVNGGSSSLYIGQQEEAKTLGFFNPQFVDGTTTDPNLREAVRLTFTPGASVSTSGDYQQGYQYADGEISRWYHHIVDPTTGYPTTSFRSVIVVTESATDADFWSTIFMAMPREDAFQVALNLDATVVFMYEVAGELQIATTTSQWVSSMDSPLDITYLGT